MSSQKVYVVVRQCFYTVYSPYTSTVGVFWNKANAYEKAARVNLSQAYKNFYLFPSLVKMHVEPGTEQGFKEFWNLGDIDDVLGKDNWVDMETFMDLMDKVIMKLIEKGDCESAYELSDYLIHSINVEDIDADSKFYAQVEESSLV